MKKILPIIFLCSLFLSCQEKTQKNESVTTKKPLPVAFSLSGKPLFSPEPSQKLVAKFQKHKENYDKDPSADNLIWYARFMAYQGKYEEAIQLYTKGVLQFPEDARFYRHRGHRYISIRKFDLAIEDYLKAVSLIQSQENEVEPDGMPNAQNIPVSTLHGNIYYHLGLAYYLKHDFPNALKAYQKCLATSNNPDNVVSATHWLYMINRRMNQTEAAKKVLDNIQKEMPVIENQAYHKATLLYKGLMSVEDLITKGDQNNSANDALDYGIGNWYLYNRDTANAKALFTKITNRKSWSSFGYIAAEKELMMLK